MKKVPVSNNRTLILSRTGTIKLDLAAITNGP